MPYDTLTIEEILNHPEVRKVTSNVNSELIERRKYKPPRCNVFANPFTALRDDDRYRFDIDMEAKKKLPGIIDNKVQQIIGRESGENAFEEMYGRKRKIGIVFSGGPAPGGHNVIAGLFDAAKRANPETRIVGFLMGPDGIVENEVVEITEDLVNQYRNLGGFGMIRTGRAKIDTEKKMAMSRETCKQLGLDALVIIGGDDSNTNAAFLAQEMLKDGVQVIGVPKTIDGDIQVKDANGHILCAMSFGFHTAARSFAKEISNLCTDSSSDVKYWHICKVMGRAASHLALEVALQTHANMAFIGEDLADYVDYRRLGKSEMLDYTAYGMTLRHLSRVICNGIVRRADVGKNFGVIVFPEGILEFINEIQIFIIKLNSIIAEYNSTHDTDFHADFPALDEKREYLRRMARRSREDKSFKIWHTRDDDLFNDLPEFFQEGLLTERDSHGNFQFSQVETDKVIMGLVTDYLSRLMEEGAYRLGINKAYFRKTLEREGLHPDYFGPIMFENYSSEGFMLRKSSIISLKTLRQTLVSGGVIGTNDPVPPSIEKIYEKTVPKFKTQTHFYGYDGRGSDPTRFDCIYTYNLGQTVFSLIANGATGQMAAIKNLEMDFSKWEPVGIPIAPLMHLEERKGKLTLVLEKCIVNLESPSFQVAKALREKWLAANGQEDDYRRPGPIRFTGKSEEDRPITLLLNSLGNVARAD
ncbi:MAG: 6-phosphofructokinase [Desulfobacterales bacterium]|nr:6-phosphofructokinase [Desulfobacterales bacterium]MDD4071087.1 6-phosphofructokinase [Desulfobacterales bacterium]MDD4392144.1 6-phosphofructokinase [Desulfobacterales bacterium]